MKIDDIIGALAPYAPSALGALIGARYAQDQKPKERVLSWLMSAALGLFIGAAVGDYYVLSRIETGGVQFALAALGMEIVAYCLALLRAGIADPLAALRKVINAVLGRAD